MPSTCIQGCANHNSIELSTTADGWFVIEPADAHTGIPGHQIALNEGDNAATITTSRPEHRPRTYTVNIHRTPRVHPTAWDIEMLSEPAPGSNDTYGVGHQIALDHGYNEIRITAVKPARYRTTYVVAAFYPITPHIDSVEIISEPGPFLSYAPGDHIEVAVNSSSIHGASVRNAGDTADASVDHRAVPHQGDQRVNAP